MLHNEESNATVDGLRRRIGELEAALKPQDVRTIPSPPLRSQSQTAVGRLHREESEIEDAATVLEFLAWGRTKDPDYNTVVSPEASRHPSGDAVDASSEPGIEACLDSGQSPLVWLQLLLPDRQQTKQLVTYHNECLLWFHASLFAPALQEQLDDFFLNHDGNPESPGVNVQWLALLFAVMASSMTSAPESTVEQWGFSYAEAQLLSRKWYKAVLTCLNTSDYMSNHSIYSVQAIATLTGPAHILGHSNSQSVLLASAVRIAQSLGLHRLTANARGTVTELEIGRRVWAQLCTQDWFSTCFSEAYLIHPLHSTSDAPRNCHDDDMRPLPDSVPTITSFSRFLTQIASIMPSLQDGMASSNTLYTKYEKVILHDKRMRALATQGRPLFLSNAPLDPRWPPYIPWARRALAMSSAHKIIMIHRKFLSMSFTNPAFAFTRRTCIAASKTILKEYIALDSDSEPSPTFWTYQAFSVAACIIICLDLLHQNSENSSDVADSDRSLLVKEAVQILSRSQHKSMIASRGVRLLNALQKEIDKMRCQPSPLRSERHGRKRRERHGDDEESSPRKRLQLFHVGDVVRSFRNDDRWHRPIADDSTAGDNLEIDLVTPRQSPSSLNPSQPMEYPEADQRGTWQHLDTDIAARMDIGRDLNFDVSQPFENLMYLATRDFTFLG